MPSISAAEDPDLARKMIAEALAEPEPEIEEKPEIEFPVDTIFDLAGGYRGPDGYTASEAEVRELTGRDEEAILKTKTSAAMTEQVLKRGLVRLGDREIDDVILDSMLAGDRELALVRIFAATFGREVTTVRVCPGCQSSVTFQIDMLTDVPIKILEDESDRTFEVQCSVGPVITTLPTGITHREIQESEGKNLSELSTILLFNTVLNINGRDVLSKADVLDLPIKDRRKIAEEIAKRAPGPKLLDVTLDCPECGHKDVEVPLSMGALFQF